MTFNDDVLIVAFVWVAVPVVCCRAKEITWQIVLCEAKCHLLSRPKTGNARTSVRLVLTLQYLTTPIITQPFSQVAIKSFMDIYALYRYIYIHMHTYVCILYHCAIKAVLPLWHHKGVIEGACIFYYMTIYGDICGRTYIHIHMYLDVKAQSSEIHKV